MPSDTFTLVGGPSRPIHVPRRSDNVPASAWQHVLPIPIPAQWSRIAGEKGFRIHSRIRDRYHVALECTACGALTAHKVFTLRTARPVCGGCAATLQATRARQAGLTFLRRDPDDRHYAFYRAGCGHEIRRQFAQVERAARGLTGTGCETCLRQREQSEAERAGWQLVAADPGGNPGYRLYRHSCGHHQRVAVANMRWRQVDCAACGKSWTARPSWIYLAEIRLPDGGHRLIKLGYSNNPRKRFKHQLGLPRGAEVDMVRTVAMPSGHAACAWEKRAHARLRRNLPEAVVPHQDYAGLLRTRSEIYRPAALPELHALLDRLEAEQTQRAAAPRAGG